MIEKAIKKNVLQMLKSYLCMEGGSEKKWSSVEEKSTRNVGPHRGKDAVGIRRKRMSNFPCNNSIIQE